MLAKIIRFVSSTFNAFFSFIRILKLRLKYPSANIDFNNFIGKNCEISCSNGAKLFMRNCYVSNSVTLKCDNEGEMSLNGVFIGKNSTIVAIKKIQIEANTLLAENVVIRDQDHLITKEIEVDHKKYSTGEINIGENCWIGAGAIVLQGVKLEKNVTIGALSLAKNIQADSNTVWVGTPIKKKKG